MRLPISLAFLLGTIGPVFCAPFDYHSVRGREARGPVDGILEGELLLRPRGARREAAAGAADGGARRPQPLRVEAYVCSNFFLNFSVIFSKF